MKNRINVFMSSLFIIYGLLNDDANSLIVFKTEVWRPTSASI